MPANFNGDDPDGIVMVQTHTLDSTGALIDGTFLFHGPYATLGHFIIDWGDGTVVDWFFPPTNTTDEIKNIVALAANALDVNAVPIPGGMVAALEHRYANGVFDATITVSAQPKADMAIISKQFTLPVPQSPLALEPIAGPAPLSVALSGTVGAIGGAT